MKKSTECECKGKAASEHTDKDCLTCPPVDRNVVPAPTKKRRRLRPKKL